MLEDEYQNVVDSTGEHSLNGLPPQLHDAESLDLAAVRRNSLPPIGSGRIDKEELKK